MLTLDLDIQQRLVIVPLSPGPLQHAHLVLLQPPPGGRLQLLPADLLPGLLLPRGLEARLEARLHAHAQRRVEGDLGLVAPHLGRGVGLCGARGADAEEGVAQGLDLERARGVGGREDGEGLERGDGVGRGG